MVRRGLLLLALLAATFLAYGPALRAEFLWDDDQYVVEEETLTEPGGLRRIWLEPGATPQYYPLVFTTFRIERALWGLEPLGYHATNVALHALAAFLLGCALARLRVPGAWVAAGVFALHPVQVESVAWVTERKNVLSAVFYMAALLAWLRFDPLEPAPAGALSRGAAADPPRRGPAWAWALAFAFFALALFAKTVACSLPAALLVLAWWRRGRATGRDAWPLLPFLFLGAWLARTTARLETEHVARGTLELGLTAGDRIVLAGRAAWFYAGKLLWPAELVFIYPRWDVDAAQAWQWLFPAAAVALVAALFALRRRIGRGPLAAVLVFGGTLVPALGFVDVFPMKYSFVADHFQYLATPAAIALAVALAARALRPAGRAAAPAAGAALLVVLGGLTWNQAHAFRDLETLWRDVLAKNENASIAHINLGNILSDREQYEEAIAHYRAVSAVEPPERDSFVRARARYNTGNQLIALNRLEEAEAEYDAALAIERRYTPAWYGRGHARMLLGRYEEARADLETMLRLVPGHAAARQSLNLVMARLRR